jgi:RND family efflux transporter MFP subunit
VNGDWWLEITNHHSPITNHQDMKRLIKIAIWVVVLGGLGWLAATQLTKNKQKIEDNSKLAQERNTVIPVLTGKVGKATWEGKFSLIGNFAPYQQVPLMSEAAGKIVQLNFDNGSSVSAGSTLATIDNDLLKIELETTKINLSKAENDYKRLSNLLGEGGVTQQQLDDAKLAIENLKAKIKGIEKQISMSYVKAPISGVVSNKIVEKGSLISPAMQLALITNVSRLKMQVYLTEEQVLSVKKGQRINLQADVLPDKKFEGTVSFIDVNAGQARRYLVEVEIPNPSGTLRAGMTGSASFDGVAAREVLAIPREAIVGSLQDAKVYVVSEGKAVLRPVETGLIFGDKVQIRNGLSEGETIVVSGQINLEDGTPIQITMNDEL